MPTSITPPPKDDETECGNCGAYIYHGLLKCSNCGEYLIDPIPIIEKEKPRVLRPRNWFALWFESLWDKMLRKPHPAEELFNSAFQEAILFDNLVRKVGGDRAVAERLIEYEKQLQGRATRLVCIQNAIARWEHENR